MNRQSSEDFCSSENILYGTVMVDTCYTFVKTHRMYNIKSKQFNCGLWMIMICHCRYLLIVINGPLWYRMLSREGCM